MENVDCESLLRHFDELNESNNMVSTSVFENHLLRWGVPKDAVKHYIDQCDPKKTGFIKRQDLCNTLNYHPNPPPFLKHVRIIETDMPQHQRESIIQIVLEETRHGGHHRDNLYRAKRRIETLYGKEWSLYQAYGGFWGLCQYKVLTNLWFNHKGITYGVFQMPKENVESSRH